MPLRRRKAWIACWPLLFAALYVATGLVVSLATAPLGDLGVEADFFAELAPAAQELAAGRFAVANHPYKGPLHAFVLVPVHAALAPLGVGWYRSAVVISLLAAAGTLLLLHRLVRELAGPRAAAVALAIAAVLKVSFIHAHKAASDPLFVLLVTAAATALLAGRPRPRAWLGCGAAAGLAWLTRDNGIVVPLWAALVLLVVDPWHLPWRRRAVAAGLVVAGFLAVASPWLVATRVQTGGWVASRNLQNIVDEFYGGDRAALVPEGGFRSLGELVARDPAHFAAHYLGNLPRHFVADLHQVTGLTFGLLALALSALLAWRRPDRRQWAYLLLGALMFAALGAVFYRPRFSLALVPVWAFATALAIERLPRRRDAAAVVVVLLAAVLHAGHATRAVRFYASQQPRHLAAAIAAAPAWAAGAVEADGRPAVLMARKPHLAHYAGLRFAAYPLTARDPQDLVDRARARGATFLAVGRIERGYLPDPAMLDRLDELPGVSVAWRDPQTIVYRVRDARGARGGS